MSAKQCLGICMDYDVKHQLDRIEENTKRIMQAVFGDEAIGLTGLVEDNKEAKKWRADITKKTVGVAGLVSGGIMGGKALIIKIFGGL
jgi:hypothetical protein